MEPVARPARNPLTFLFGWTERVTRADYALVGFSLMALKFVCETMWMRGTTGHWLSPMGFFLPFLPERRDLLTPLDERLLWVPVVFTLPFLWIAVSMTARRGLDSGVGAWPGLLVLVPVVNVLVMLGLCLPPSQRPPGQRRFEGEPRGYTLDILLGLAISLPLQLGLFYALVFFVETFGTSLFWATPLLGGLISGFLLNRGRPAPWLGTIGVGVLSPLLGAAALFLFRADGLLCIAVGLVVTSPVSILGACVGKLLATGSAPRRDLVSSLVALPLCLASDVGERATHDAPPERVVLSTIDIDAPPDAVWKNVVEFSELPPPRHWIFDLGIAYPLRARIAGRGVGAIRNCEFSTGPFVEPITAWDEPRRLAFDVASQPPAMEETSFTAIHPPHLDGYIRSLRGEFLLVPLPGGRTRLEGRTWYALEVWPAAYFGWIADVSIHRIHERVLAHVRELSER